jgi:hypothetical protein
LSSSTKAKGDTEGRTFCEHARLVMYGIALIWNIRGTKQIR